MPCLFAMFAGLFPRLGALFLWLARPAMWNAAFGGSWLWPLLGVIFLPWTTLAYVLVFTGGVNWFDWIILAFALFIDVGTYTGGGYANRRRSA